MILTFVSVTITMTSIVAVLAIHAHEAQAPPIPRSLFAIPANPNTRKTDVVLFVLDARRPPARRRFSQS
jgi:hypothetical protein